MKDDPGLVVLFPTEDGLDEYVKAAVTGDDEAMAVVRRTNGGFLVAKGTKCLWLDVGFSQTKVRILEGPHQGRAGFAPTEWVRGD